jgi:hypothetical protein
MFSRMAAPIITAAAPAASLVESLLRIVAAPVPITLAGRARDQI